MTKAEEREMSKTETTNIIGFPLSHQKVPGDLVERLRYWDKLLAQHTGIPEQESDWAKAADKIEQLQDKLDEAESAAKDNRYD